jgi:hypothetical protein
MPRVSTQLLIRSKARKKHSSLTVVLFLCTISVFYYTWMNTRHVEYYGFKPMPIATQTFFPYLLLSLRTRTPWLYSTEKCHTCERGAFDDDSAIAYLPDPWRYLKEPYGQWSACDIALPLHKVHWFPQNSMFDAERYVWAYKLDFDLGPRLPPRSLLYLQTYRSSSTLALPVFRSGTS